VDKIQTLKQGLLFFKNMKSAYNRWSQFVTGGITKVEN